MSQATGQRPTQEARKWKPVVLPCVVFCAFVALYGATLLPDILPADAGEFQLVAKTAGVAHPPGYPLYTMLGWLFAHMPIGPTPAWRLNLFSAVAGAATLGLVFATARKLSGCSLSGFAAALSLGSATTFWATATQASIRPLTTFFTALCLFALVEHRSHLRQQASGAGQRTDPSPRDGYVVLFSLALSLGLTHHPSLAFPAVVFVLYLVLIDPALLRSPRRWLKPAVAFLPGLLVLTYLPLRGAPDLATWSGFLDHVLARGFRGDMFALNLFDRLVLLPTLLRFQFNSVLVLGMLLAGLFLLWRDRRLALLVIGSFAVHTAATLTYDAPQTLEYEMPAYVSLALLVAVPFQTISAHETGASDSTSRPRDLRSALSLVPRLIPVVLLAAGLLNLLAHLPSYRTLSGSRDARGYAKMVLYSAPENAVLLSNWHWFSPFRYLQQVEGLRADVEVEYIAPRGEPLARTWVGHIEEHIDERPVVVVRYFEDSYSDLPYGFEPLGEAFLVRREPRAEVPADMTGLNVILGERIKLIGYRLDAEASEPSQPLTLTLAWSSLNAPTTDIALFAQLIGADGRLWSAGDDPVHRGGKIRDGEVIVDRFVVYPLLHASPGDYKLVVGAYTADGRLTTGDGSDSVPLDTVRLHRSTTRPVTEHPRLIRYDDGPSLIGVDYDIRTEGSVRTYLHWAGPGKRSSVQLEGRDGTVLNARDIPFLQYGQYATIAVDSPVVPQGLTVLDEHGPRRWNLLFQRSIGLPAPQHGARYVPIGDAMVLTKFDARLGKLEPEGRVTLRLRFHGQRPLERDYIVSTALTGLEADGTWSWRASHDSVPALGAIPTLKWIRGSLVVDPHRLTIPGHAPAVPVVGSFLVYDHFTQRLLPPLDEQLNLSVKLGTWNAVSQ